MTMTSTGIDTTYNGWANYETWNVALYLQNEYAMYEMACHYSRQCKRLDETCNYDHLIPILEMHFSQITPDGVRWMDPVIDVEELSEMITELTD